jgi:intracellular multiplication protein IcmO
MTVFDEVGYYTAQGMAVMAAQYLPSMEKRIKQEAQSILANCNLKIFGKLEDPGDTKKFFGDHAGDGFVLETNGMQAKTDTISGLFMNKPFYDNYGSTGPVLRVRAAYDQLRGQREGEVHMFFAEFLVRARMFYAVPDKVQALRVHKLLPLPPTLPTTVKRERAISEVGSRLKDPDWTAATIAPQAKAAPEITRLAEAFAKAKAAGQTPSRAAMVAVGGLPEIITEAPKLFDDEAPVKNAASASSQSSSEKKAAQPVTWSPSSATTAKEEPVAEKASFLDIPRSGYVPRDIDTSVVPKVEVESEADVTKLKLPDDITAYIESMATKFNKGFGSGTASKDSE